MDTAAATASSAEIALAGLIKLLPPFLHTQQQQQQCSSPICSGSCGSPFSPCGRGAAAAATASGSAPAATPSPEAAASLKQARAGATFPCSRGRPATLPQQPLATIAELHEELEHQQQQACLDGGAAWGIGLAASGAGGTAFAAAQCSPRQRARLHAAHHACFTAASSSAGSSPVSTAWAPAVGAITTEQQRRQQVDAAAAGNVCLPDAIESPCSSDAAEEDLELEAGECGPAGGCWQRPGGVRRSALAGPADEPPCHRRHVGSAEFRLVLPDPLPPAILGVALPQGAALPPPWLRMHLRQQQPCGALVPYTPPQDVLLDHLHGGSRDGSSAARSGSGAHLLGTLQRGGRAEQEEMAVDSVSSGDEGTQLSLFVAAAAAIAASSVPTVLPGGDAMEE